MTKENRAGTRWRGAAVLTAAALAAIRFYQATLRWWLGWGCKFHPTCSEYAIQAIQTKGPGRGLALAGRRLLRCRPGTLGGFDPVPEDLPVPTVRDSRFPVPEKPWRS